MLAALLLSVALCAPAEEGLLLGPKPMPRVLFPINYAVIEASAFEVIAAAPENGSGTLENLALRIDGKDHAWEIVNPPNYSARVELAPGRHTIAVNQIQLAVFVAVGDIERPKDWPVAQRHPLKEGSWQDCAACHALPESAEKKLPGGFLGAEACDACHKEKPCTGMAEHARKPSLRACNLCHAVHGSMEKKLLAAPKEKLCTTCHDASGRVRLR